MKFISWIVRLVLLITYCYGQDIIPKGCEVYTTTGYKYANFVHLPSDSINGLSLTFRVMAKSDAHIALTTSPLAINPLYEIVLGAAGNNYTDLRRMTMGRSLYAVRTPSLLSDSEYRGFWISVNQGQIELGKEGETLPFFHWKDPDPLNVHFYGFSSWTNTVAKWVHKCNLGGPMSWMTSTNNKMENTSMTPRPGDDIVYYNVVEKLRNDLLVNYNRDIRPSASHGVPVTIDFGVNLNHFDLDEHSSRFVVQCITRMAWRDERLAWNNSHYEGVNVIRLPSQYLWLPDIVLYNNADANDMVHYADSQVIIYSDGSVLWVPPATLPALCRLDLRYWPFDTQVCQLKFGSWAHDGFSIDISLYRNMSKVDIQDYEANDGLSANNLQWKLVDTEAKRTELKYPCCDEPYPSLLFSFTIRRRSPSYWTTVVGPALAIIALTLSTFMLPPNSREKILIGLVNLVILSLYLMYFNLILPAMGDHLPLLISFYGGTMVLTTISIILSVMTMRWMQIPSNSRLAYGIKSLLLGPFGRVLGLGSLIQVVQTRDHEQRANKSGMEYSPQINSEVDTQSVLALTAIKASAISTTMNDIELEWYLLASALDRLVFFIYLIVFGILMSSCL